MEELFMQLLALAIDSGYALYVFLWCAFCAIFAAVAPVSVTAKIPNWAMVVINVSALNVGKATNALSDVKGNPKNGKNSGNVSEGS